MKSNHFNCVIGITDQETVKLDFDETPFGTVKYWAMRTMKWHKLKGFIILKSSKNSYHVVFDRKVDWSENMRIVAWVCQQSKHKKLTGWLIFQCIKQGSTLRVSSKKDKPTPRIVYRYGSQENQIKEFLAYRRKIKNIMRKLQRECVEPQIRVAENEKTVQMSFSK